MKRSFPFLLIFLLFFGSTVLAIAATQHRIQVKKTALLASPSAFGKRISVLNFNTPVRILSQKQGYCRVRAVNKTGYVHQSALLAQKSFREKYKGVDSGSDHSYSSSAATAATKGFSEAEVQQRNRLGGRARYDLVRKVMQFHVFSRTAGDWTRFRREGSLGEFRKLRPNELNE